MTAATVIADVVDKYDNDLVDLRRDLHAHPELSWSELRTAEVGRRAVEQAGWQLTRFSRTGLRRRARARKGRSWRCAATSTRCPSTT